MELAIIVWMYVVGLVVSYSLFHEITRHWSGVVIVLGWPVMVPLVWLAKHMGWIERVRIWGEIMADRHAKTRQ